MQRTFRRMLVLPNPETGTLLSHMIVYRVPVIAVGATNILVFMDQEVTVNPAAHLEDELWDSCVRNDANEDGDGDDDDGYDDYIQQLTEASCTPNTVPPNPDREP